MNNRMLWNCCLGLALGVLVFAGSCTHPSSVPATSLPSSPDPLAMQPAPDLPDPLESTPAPETTPAPDPADAPVTSLQSQATLPSGIPATGPVAEILKLARAGVDENILLAFAQNSTAAFNLSADAIVYFNDIGIPASVLSAMLQRDQALKNLASATPIPAPEPAAPTPAPAPAPVYAPQPAYVTETETPAPVADVADPDFTDSLSPYGTWLDVAGVGRCWQPAVAAGNPDWQPYFDGGRWLYTSAGWYWVSDYSWGWAPFHYGRWFRHHRMGWCWVPDKVWGPAWVCWRFDDTACGWAPLPPGSHYQTGIGLVFHDRPVRSLLDLHLSIDCFPFVEWAHFPDYHLRQNALDRAHVNHIFDHTKTALGSTGELHPVKKPWPAPDHVVAATHREIKPVAIQDVVNASVRPGRPELLSGDTRTASVVRIGNPPSDQSQMTPGSNRGTDRHFNAHGQSATAAASGTPPQYSTALVSPGAGTRRPNTTPVHPEPDQNTRTSVSTHSLTQENQHAAPSHNSTSRGQPMSSNLQVPQSAQVQVHPAPHEPPSPIRTQASAPPADLPAHHASVHPEPSEASPHSHQPTVEPHPVPAAPQPSPNATHTQSSGDHSDRNSKGR